MALTDFYPWQPGQKIKPEDLNELVQLIQDGTIFENTTLITSQLHSNGVRLDDHEARIVLLESLQNLLSIREQFVLTDGQQVIPLAQPPVLDSEIVFLNGSALAKTGVPLGFSGKYTLSGSTLTLSSELASQIVAGDILIVVYRYED
jgi:hypothetical protein